MHQFLPQRVLFVKQMLPIVCQLARMNNSDGNVWSTLLLLCETAIRGETGDIRYFAKFRFGIRHLHEELDDALVDARLRMADKNQKTAAWLALQQLNSQREEWRRKEFDSFVPRTIQLLKEQVVHQVAEDTTRRALQSSPLPPELVQMVGDELQQLHKVPLGYMDTWTTPRPKVPLCPTARQWGGRDPLEGLPFPQVCRGAVGEVCWNRTSVGWWCKERRWVWLHWVKYPRAIFCVLEDCDGHHREDFEQHPTIHEWDVAELLRVSDRSTLASYLQAFSLIDPSDYPKRFRGIAPSTILEGPWYAGTSSLTRVAANTT